VSAPTGGDAEGRDGSGPTAAGRAAVAAELAGLRLGELRSGVWARPANLRRGWPISLQDRVWRFEVRTIDSSGGWRPREPKELAADLWDLDGWASRADALLDAFLADDQPARRFVVAAAIVRHLQTDPLLPRSLLPTVWPGARLRGAYTSYERELGDLLRRERRLHG
jgi:phenylacetic acid degradation operon negative regulatory protein